MTTRFRLAATLLLAALMLSAPAHWADAASDVGTRDRPVPPDPIALALDAAGAGQLAVARRLAGRAAGQAALPNAQLLDKLLRWRWATAPGTRPPFGVLQDVLAHDPDWPRRRTVVRKAQDALPAWWDGERRLAWYAVHPPVGTKARLDRVSALAETGQDARLAEAVRALWRETPLNARRAAELRERFGHLLDRADDLARLTAMLDAGAYASASRVAERLGGAYPDLVTARRKLARREPGVDAAVEALPENLRGRPGLLNDRARWRLRSGMVDGVAEILAQLDDPPKPARWWSIRHWTARELMQAGRHDRAYAVADGHGLSEGLGFAEGEWLAGWLALTRLDRPEDALAHFERLHDGVSTPISRSRGAYWAGRAAERLGRPDEARGWYAVAGQHWTTFYGQLARGRLGSAVVPPRALAEARAQPAGAPGDPELSAAARLLARHGQPRLADAFLYTLAARADAAAEARAVADLAWSLERPQVALWLGRRTRGDGLVLADVLFPRHPLLTGRPQAALLHAIGRQESGFDPEAVSSAGARGLLQLMPATAERTARKAGLPVATDALTRDPAYNAELGARHIDDLLARFDGSRLLAIAAYNAGAGRIDEWIERFGDPRGRSVDVVDWIERIPFGETRNYVQRVIEGYNVYRHDLGEAPQMPERIARADSD